MALAPQPLTSLGIRPDQQAGLGNPHGGVYTRKDKPTTNTSAQLARCDELGCLR